MLQAEVTRTFESSGKTIVNWHGNCRVYFSPNSRRIDSAEFAFP